jgi:hypothetical protein
MVVFETKKHLSKITCKVRPQGSGIPIRPTYDEVMMEFTTFWECSLLWALPIVMHEANIIMNLNI